jgi:cytochrome bd-type quinol oxidase subunit 1
MGFMGLYLLIGALYVLIFMRIVHQGPQAQHA